MNNLTARIFIFLITAFLYSCGSDQKKSDQSDETSPTDTMEIIRNFIYGLWSMDSGNALNNEGFYFKPDGTVDFVSSELSGFWELPTNDSIHVVYSTINEKFSSPYKINSITESRMILTDQNGNHLFRKIPFGINNERVVLQGFAGALAGGMKKKYSFDIPSAKKINLILNSENKNISFQVFDDANEFTSVPVREWTAIMVRSGKYKVVVSNTGNSKEDSHFDLKVMGY
jgi:hypothetical protein